MSLKCFSDLMRQMCGVMRGTLGPTLKADTEEAQQTKNVEFFSQVLILTPCKGHNGI